MDPKCEPQCMRYPPIPGTAGTGALGRPIQVQDMVSSPSGVLKLPSQLLQNGFYWAQRLQFAPQ